MRRTIDNANAAAFVANAGFSFIELLVAVSVASVIAVTAVPRIPRMFAAYDVATAAGQVALDLRYARERAITANSHARLQFDGQTYTRQRESAPGSGTYVTEGAMQKLPSTVTVATDPGTPTFDSRGLTPQPYTVTITNSYGQSKTITVTTIGRVNLG